MATNVRRPHGRMAAWPHQLQRLKGGDLPGGYQQGGLVTRRMVHLGTPPPHSIFIGHIPYLKSPAGVDCVCGAEGLSGVEYGRNRTALKHRAQISDLG